MKWLTFDIRTGRKLRSLPTTAGGRWSTVLNDAGGLSCTVPVSVETVALNLRESTREWRTGLAAVEGDLVLQAGPIVARRYDLPTMRLELTALGFWAVFDRRFLVPSLWDDVEVAGPVDAEDPDWEFAVSGSYSDWVRSIIVNETAWADGELPVVLPDVTGGDHTWAYSGFDATPAGEVFRQITQRQDGPQIRFDPRYMTDKLGFEFLARIGSDELPYLGGDKMFKWSASAADSPISNLSLSMNGRAMGSQGWSFGGRQSESAVLVKSRDPWLTDKGWPLLDIDDQEHSNASDPDTLASYMTARLERSRRTSDVWTFDVQRDRPAVGTYRVGDNVDLKVEGDPFIADGIYRLRLTSLSGSNDSDKVSVEAVERG